VPAEKAGMNPSRAFSLSVSVLTLASLFSLSACGSFRSTRALQAGAEKSADKNPAAPLPPPAATVNLPPITPAPATRTFNSYVLKAVQQISESYLVRGYSINDALTHDIAYGDLGFVRRLHPDTDKTMCVAAQLEIILTALEIYSQETADLSVFRYLPKSSWEHLSKNDIRGHIWVNSRFNAYGTADALRNFGMGEKIPFQKLTPGAFININRVNGSGHAVTFLSFIDASGQKLQKYGTSVVGFQYFSAQGKSAIGSGGFDFRDAVFSQFGCPVMPIKRDCGVIYSTSQVYLNTGQMLAPAYWQTPKIKAQAEDSTRSADSEFNAAYFNGLTTDD
jgi:hypothetical protein